MLRNEDYIAFLDESGEQGLEVVSGVFIPARWLRAAERRWQDFVRAELGFQSGRAEVKSRELLKGQGVSIHAQAAQAANGRGHRSAEAAGRLFYRNALEHIATLTEVRVMSVGLKTKYPTEAYRLWYWMACALLVERPKSPRPRLGLTVIDGQDAAFRRAHDLITFRFYRAFPRCQTYVARGSSWFMGGSIHQDSKLHPFVQMADLVAGAARHAIAKRKPQGNWYADHLVDYAANLRYPRAIDVSSDAIGQLKRRSRQDACGSGWPVAKVP